MDKLNRSYKPRFQDLAVTLLDSERKALLANINEIAGKARRAKASIQWQQVVSDLAAFYQKQEVAWREAYAPLMSALITDQGHQWNASLGTSFAVPNIYGADWFNGYTLTFAQQVNETTLTTLGDMFAQAQLEGWTVQQMQNRMNQLFNQWMTGDETSSDWEWYAQRLPPWRTEMIARTETLRSSNYGSFNLFQEWGVKKKEWLATFDDRTRKSHVDAGINYGRGGRPGAIPMEQPFMVNGNPMMCPGDISAPASETVNCRCTILPVLE